MAGVVTGPEIPEAPNINNLEVWVSLASVGPRNEPGPASNSKIMGIDTMCSYGVCANKELYGNNKISDEVTFSVVAWDGKARNITKHGKTKWFGKMIFIPDAPVTLLSVADMVHQWKLYWDDSWLSCTAVHKIMDIKLVFRIANTNEKYPNLLVTDATDVWDKLTGKVTVHAKSVDVLKEMTIENPGRINEPGYKRALEVLELHRMACHPGDKELYHSIKCNWLRNSPISEYDIHTACWLREGSCAACTASKMTRQSYSTTHKKSSPGNREIPDHKVEDTGINDPKNGETLGIDLMFIDTLPFLLSVGTLTGMIHVVHVPEKSATTVGKALRFIIDDYKRFRLGINDVSQVVYMNDITRIEGDGEAAFVNAGLHLLPEMGINLKTQASGDHVGIVERQIRTIRNRVGAIRAECSWFITGTILKWLVINAATWINLLVRSNRQRSAYTTVTGIIPKYQDITRAKFGDYVTGFRPEKHLKSGDARGEPGICLGPHIKTPGAINFYSISTGRVKPRSRFVHSEEPDLGQIFGYNKVVVPRPRYYSTLQSYLKYRNMRSSGNNYAMNSDEEKDTSIPLHPTTSLSTDMLDETEVEGIDPVVLDTLHGIECSTPSLLQLDSTFRLALEVPDDDDEDNNDPPSSDSMASPTNWTHSNSNQKEYISTVDENTYNESGLSTQGPINLKPTNLNEELKQEELVQKRIIPQRTYYSRAAKDAKKESIGMANLQDRTLETSPAGSNIPVSTNTHCGMGWSRALKSFGNGAADAIDAELRQFALEYDVFQPILDTPNTFFRSHDLFDQKADGRLKARLVVGKLNNDSIVSYGVELYSPTIDLKLIYSMLSLCFNNNLRLSVWDIKGAFLKAPLNVSGVFVKLEPHVVSRLIRIKPEWREFVTYNGSMFVECQKAWYGTAAASALWNKEIHGTLTSSCAYNQHPMVKCLYYKIINSVYHFIMLHVDDLGVMMPEDNKEYTRVKDILEKKYETMKIKYGDKVSYIGLVICKTRDCYTVDMSERIAALARDFGVTKSVANPGSSTFGDKRIRTKSSVDITQYRSLVMSLRYIAMLVKPECLYHASFLASFQSNPDEIDYKNGIRILQYMLGTKDHKIKIRGFNNSTIYVYADASYNCHLNGRSHSSKTVFIGDKSAAVYCSSNKQHCVTDSSTDAEIVGLEEAIFLGNYFQNVFKLIGQDMNLIYYQDNTSAIKLVNDGTDNYMHRLGHMVRRINTIQEYLSNETNKASIIHCGTDKMITDMGTKCLFGNTFINFRDITTGHVHMPIIGT